jgi:hypothetical protein
VAILPRYSTPKPRGLASHRCNRVGKGGARDFDKVIFNLPIPRFDAAIALHARLADAAAEAEKLAAAVDIPDSVGFVRARKLVRYALTKAGISERIDALVAQLLDGS